MKASSMIMSLIEDKKVYQASEPKLIILSEDVYKKLLNEVEEELNSTLFGGIVGRIDKLARYNGYKIKVDYTSTETKIIIE